MIFDFSKILLLHLIKVINLGRDEGAGKEAKEVRNTNQKGD